MNLHPDFRRFARATDPEAVRPALERGLERAWNAPVELHALHVPRAFARPLDGFTIQYRAEAHTTAAPGGLRLLLCGHLLGPDEPWPAYAALDDRAVRIDALRLVIPVFPFDPKLGALPDLATRERAAALVRATLGSRCGTLEGEPEVLAYRLERRAVLRYRFAAATPEAQHVGVIAKTFRKSQVESIRRAIQLLETAGADDDDDAAPPSVAPTWALDEERGIQWMEEAPGGSLHDAIGTPVFATGCEAAGRGLRALHALPVAALPAFTADDALRRLGAVTTLAGRMFPESAAAFAAAARAVAAARPEHGEITVSHRDYYDKQVLHAPHRTTLLDWDGIAAGDPAEDHGNFVAHLRLRALQAPEHGPQLERGAGAFEHGYGRLDDAFATRSAWWQASSLVRLAALYALRRRWRHLTPDLLHKSTEVLTMITRPSRARALLFGCLLLAPLPALAVPPEYMQLRPRVGQTLEIGVVRARDGMYVATDVEEMPEPRRPSLRGAIEAVDADKRTLTVLGIRMQLTAETLSEDPDSLRVPIAKLAPGHRVEVSCKVADDGTWIARRVRAHGVKSNDKIKGTITRTAVDGVPPDTLEISGFRILLDAQTDVNRRLGGALLERTLFGDLALRDAVAATATGGVALADGRLRLRARYRQGLRTETEFDLSQRFGSDENLTEPEVRLELGGFWTEHLRTFAQLRLRGSYVLSSDRDGAPNTLDGQITQLYALWKSPRNRRVALQVGRQDFDEPREWIFDDYQDAVRLYAWGRRSLVLEGAVLHAVHPLKETFATWTDGLAMARWYFGKRSHAAAWLLARSDTDVRNRQPVWAGLRYTGARWRGDRVRPWLDLALMRGEDKGRTLRAWAADGGATFLGTGLRFVPSATLGWAVGSGDASTRDGVDGNFRQTGYQDNWGRFGGVASLHYYGTLLDPELSNIEITTAGLGCRPMPNASVDLVYHRYRQNEPDDRLRSNNLVDPPARPNGVDPDLGWGLDLVLVSPLLWRVLRAKWTSAFFDPGTAFGPRQENAFLHGLELTLEH